MWDLFGYGWNAGARALLLVGPPGSGKTTLAHIVARAAGYRVAEVNASDDRGKKSIVRLVASAQDTQAVFGDKRPACVVLDEIDGMDATAIAELVRMLRATPSPLLGDSGGGGGGGSGSGGSGAAAAAAGANREGGAGDSEEEGEGGSAAAAPGPSGGGSRKRPRRARATASGETEPGGGAGGGAAIARLTRPLLCICNDLYAPALRELRPLVQVVEFHKASSEKLLARLRAIVAAEGMSVSREALSALISLTDADVRSCLHTLQYLRGQQRHDARAALGGGRLRITADMLAAAAVGAKDQTRALFDVWDAAFRTPDARRRGGGGGSLAAAAASYRADLFASAGAFASEPALLLAGLHENLLSARGADPTMQHTAAALDWLCYGEELSHRALTRAAYPLLKYFPAAVVGVHLRAASELRLRPAWPRAEGGFRQRRDASRNIVGSFLSGRAAAPRSRGAPPPPPLSTATAVLDVLPPLVTMALCAPLRPVSFTLMNSKERQLALDTVQFLAGVGLTFAVVGGAAAAAGWHSDAEFSLVPCVPPPASPPPPFACLFSSRPSHPPHPPPHSHP